MMIKKILKYILPFTLLIGTFLIALQINNINGLSVITTRSIRYNNSYTWTYYYFDINLYLKNLDTALSNTNFFQLKIQMPTLPEIPGNTDILGWVKFIGSIMLIYIVNWLIWVANILLLYPLKMILYPINVIITIFGINTSNNDYINAITTLYNTNIPYIPYF